MNAPTVVRILYFAWVREMIGTAEEEASLDAPMTLEALAEMLRGRSAGHARAFADLSRLRVAVNQDFTRWSHLIVPGDEVAIFPPVTGG